MLERKTHWEKIFARKSAAEVSWYKPHLDISLGLIAGANVLKSAPVIDVGGGDSSLVDDLLKAGYSDVTVLDISAAALERTRKRLGSSADAVTWFTADITEISFPPETYELWHDRAMFHFLTSPDSRTAYLRACETAVKQGGTVIIAAFAEDGPEQCSGLPTMRYAPGDLAQQLGSSFRLVETSSERHVTPAGKTQSFVYCMFKKQPKRDSTTDAV